MVTRCLIINSSLNISVTHGTITFVNNCCFACIALADNLVQLLIHDAELFSQLLSFSVVLNWLHSLHRHNGTSWLLWHFVVVVVVIIIVVIAIVIAACTLASFSCNAAHQIV